MLRRTDSVRNTRVADATLFSDERETRQHFGRTLVTAQGDGLRGERQRAMACAHCGAVEAVDPVEAKRDGSNVLDTIAGGVLGGVVGNQVGDRRGSDIARIVGAVGGAPAGNRVPNNMDKKTVHRVTVRPGKRHDANRRPRRRPGGAGGHAGEGGERCADPHPTAGAACSPEEAERQSDMSAHPRKPAYSANVRHGWGHAGALRLDRAGLQGPLGHAGLLLSL